jgi:hypothetical protein
VPANVTAVVATPLHTVWFDGAVTAGVGLTVTVKLCGVPAQPLADGLTVMVPAMADVPLFVPVNAPMPAAVVGPEPRPMAVLVFTQV